MRSSTLGQFEGTAATGCILANSKMRSAPASAMLGKLLRILRTLVIGPASEAPKLPSNSCLIRALTSFILSARSSGNMPPGLRAAVILAGCAASITSGSVPILLVSSFQPLLQEASLAGYPQYHQSRNRYGSEGQQGTCFP